MNRDVEDEFLPLTRLKRFEVLARIGSGGMASIYLARVAGPAGFEKPVALKVIHHHLAAEPSFVQMFLNEAKIAAQLQHPNIVQINELGEIDGMYFIAMEYLRGVPVTQIIKKVIHSTNGKMDIRMACHIVMQACEGLHHAHNTTDVDGRPLGVVHRDICPQNIFVTYSGGVKLVDFGIARAAPIGNVTKPGSLKGKFAYMAPEQAAGRDIDCLADIFALGIVLWEMLACRRLFRGDTDLETLRKVAEARVPRLSLLRADVPLLLDKVVKQALSRDRKQRFQTAMELNRALDRVVEALGGSVTTHELATWMAALFPHDELRKKALLTRPVRPSQWPQPPDAAFDHGSQSTGDTPSPSFSEIPSEDSNPDRDEDASVSDLATGFTPASVDDSDDRASASEPGGESAEEPPVLEGRTEPVLAEAPLLEVSGAPSLGDPPGIDAQDAPSGDGEVEGQHRDEAPTAPEIPGRKKATRGEDRDDGPAEAAASDPSPLPAAVEAHPDSLEEPLARANDDIILPTSWQQRPWGWYVLGAVAVVVVAATAIVIGKDMAPDDARETTVNIAGSVGAPRSDQDGPTGDDVSPAAMTPAPDPEPARSTPDAGDLREVLDAGRAEAPAQPSAARVILSGLPEGARILVDGERVSGPAVLIPRDGREHRIEVIARGLRPWRRLVRADEASALSVEMAPVEAPTPPDRPARPGQPSQVQTKAGVEVVRNPGF